MIEVTHQWWYDANTNFGDWLGPLILRHAFGADLPRAEEHKSESVILSVGSVLHVADRFRTCVVWGTGYEPAYGRLRRHDLSAIAVRGPLTKDKLGLHCNVLGDPAVVLPMIYPKEVTANGEVSVVPHHTNERTRVPYRVISPSQDWKKVVDEICESRFCFCESLHGAIICQAYGVPWAWWRGRHGRKAVFKWHDWFGSIGAEPKSFWLRQLPKAELWWAKTKRVTPSAENLLEVLRAAVTPVGL